ncbi:MAG: GlsB/YeaQ/YmgE family stress response membrane protein [Clostridia bacterium]|nr:GlsB/YeaQ/YmgE family stress response membrane protein [Clostridia bacterium]
MLWKILVAVVIGAVSGWAAGKLMKSDGSLLRNIILGILGGALGGWLGSLIGIGGGWVMAIILSIAGACLIIFLWRLIFKKK